MRPNLADPEEAAAYRRELRRLMRVPRLIGFLLVLAGTGIVIYAQREGISGPLKPIGFGVLAVGWLNLFAIIYYRTRYHKARMAEDRVEQRVVAGNLSVEHQNGQAVDKGPGLQRDQPRRLRAGLGRCMAGGIVAQHAEGLDRLLRRSREEVVRPRRGREDQPEQG